MIYLRDIALTSFWLCLVCAVMVFVTVSCGPRGTSCLWWSLGSPHPLLNLDSAEIRRSVVDIMDIFRKLATLLTCPKVLMWTLSDFPRRSQSVPSSLCCYFTNPIPPRPERRAAACIDQRTNNFRRGGICG